MLRETISKILGEGADVDMAIAIKKTINSYPQVSGAYDLVIHNYGPNTYNGSVHIEIPDTLSADELDRLIRKITEDVYAKHNIILTAIGVYSVNTKDEEAVKIREDIAKIVFDIEYIIGMHGFYLDKEDKKIRFDVVISFDASDRYEVYRLVCGKVKEAYPDYDFQIAMDMDFSEI